MNNFKPLNKETKDKLGPEFYAVYSKTHALRSFKVTIETALSYIEKSILEGDLETCNKIYNNVFEQLEKSRKHFEEVGN